MKKFPSTPDQLIPMLQYVQGELGYLAQETMAGIADYLRLPMSHVYGVATFYAQFRFRPLGQNRLTVCRGTACHVRGSARLVEEIERILGIKAGSTTADMLFSLETVACLGSCALAPAVVVNDKVHGKVTTKKMQKIIDDLRSGAGAGPAGATRPAVFTPPEPVSAVPPAAAAKAASPRLIKPQAAPAGRSVKAGKTATAGQPAKPAAAKTSRPAGKSASSKSAPGRKNSGSTRRGQR